MKYSLVGVDGNAYSVMGYTSRALRREGFGKDVIDKMHKEAMSGDYDHLVSTCMNYIDMANESAERNGET